MVGIFQVKNVFISSYAFVYLWTTYVYMWSIYLGIVEFMLVILFGIPWYDSYCRTIRKNYNEKFLRLEKS